MPSTTNLTKLTINYVASQSVYDAMVDQELINDNELYLIPGDNTYVLPIASASSLGGIKVGSNLSITDTGVLSAVDSKYNLSKPSTRSGYTGIDIKLTGSDGAAGQNNYVNIPAATQSALGLMSAADKKTLDDLSGIDGFSKVRVYTSNNAYTDVAANDIEDTLVFKSGGNISFTPTDNDNTIIISASDTKYGATSESIDIINSITSGVAATLTTETINVGGIKYGSTWTTPSMTKSNVTIPNVTSAGTATSASVSAGVLTITNGTAPTLGTALTATYISAWDAGTLPETESQSFEAVKSWTTNTPTVVTKKSQTVLTALQANG